MSVRVNKYIAADGVMLQFDLPCQLTVHKLKDVSEWAQFVFVK